jgi:acetyl-CoA carboxylase biotin carboxyl carrier protein
MARREVRSEITGRVFKIAVNAGDRVGIDDPIVFLESMKMEIPVGAPAAGLIAEICVKEQDRVDEGQIIAVLES